jgi:hypothetical protein
MTIIPGYIIDKQRRDREQQERDYPAQIPLQIPVPPPGWDENGEREKPKEDGNDPYTISMI